MKVEMGKTYRTREGNAVRIYAVDCGGDYPVHAAFLDAERGWQVNCYTSAGETLKDVTMQADLIEVKPVVTRDVWMNQYARNPEYNHDYASRETADRCATCERTACLHLRLTFPEGCGLTGDSADNLAEIKVGGAA